MGFVNYQNESDVAYGNGAFDPEVIWEQGRNGTTYASLAYDPENVLHRIVAGDHLNPTSGRIQLAIGGYDRHASDMSVSLVHQSELAAAV
jgi:hypothetical protein